MKTIASYSIGLVMTRAGLNEAQVLVLKHHIKERARIAAELALVVPVVINHGDQSGGPKAIQYTRRLLAPLELGVHVFLRVEDIAPVEGVVLRMRDCDEVWCATARNHAETGGRPARVHALAQAFREAPRFKFLHYYVDATRLRGGSDVLPKKKPALKGW